MPQEALLGVEPMGPCSICGQEQLRHRRMLVDLSRGGLGLQLRVYLECGCGFVLQSPDLDREDGTHGTDSRGGEVR